MNKLFECRCLEYIKVKHIVLAPLRGGILMNRIFLPILTLANNKSSVQGTITRSHLCFIWENPLLHEGQFMYCKRHYSGG